MLPHEMLRHQLYLLFLRTVRLNSDAAEADAKLAGTPLWRRAEPGDDPELAAAMVADIAWWMSQCAA